MTDQQMLDRVNAEIESLLTMLIASGVEVSPWFRADVAVESLVNFLIPDDDQRLKFALANAENVRKRLLAQIKQLQHEEDT